MAESDTLLAHLILDIKLTSQVEVVASRSLAYILNKSAEATHALVDLISCQTGAALGEIVGIVAEDVYQTKGGSGRIDFVGYDAIGEKRIVGEAKFDAALLSGQGGGYLHQLAKEGDAVLMFVVPARRSDYLWGEVRRDIEATGEGAVVGETEAKGRIMSAQVKYEDRNWHLMMISWRDLLNRLDEESNAVAGVQSDITQLTGLTESMDEAAFQQLKEEDISQELPHLLLALTRLIDTVIDAYGVQEGLLKVEGYRASATFDGFVRYFELIDSGVKAWFGFSYRRWSNHGISPLWFGLQGPGANGQIEHKANADIVGDIEEEFEGLPDGSFPIRLKTGVDYQEVLNHVVAQFASIEASLKQHTSEQGS